MKGNPGGLKLRRGSDWLAFKRSLAIFQRLVTGPANGDELMQTVLEIVGPEAYPESGGARRAAFKRDRKSLREHLGVVFTYDAVENLYFLDDAGPFGLLRLSAEHLQALGLLAETFTGEVGECAAVHELIDMLVHLLPPEARRKIEGTDPAVELDGLRMLDGAPISSAVWDTVSRAVRQHRELAFNHVSPQYEDRLARFHRVAPYQIQLRGGHWYLYAYDLHSRNPEGKEWRDIGHRRFRLSYIAEDDVLAVLPNALPPGQRRPPRRLVHYRLLPPVGRGTISQHFAEMQVTRLADGSAEVQGYTDSEWDAVRILLAYGENCIVLGSSEVKSLMLKRLKGMFENYNLLVDEI